jgi:hypothetical protein
MPEAVYRMLTLLCTLVVALPVGTNLGLPHLLRMLVSGRPDGPRLSQDLGAQAALSEPGLPAISTRQGNWSGRLVMQA